MWTAENRGRYDRSQLRYLCVPKTKPAHNGGEARQELGVKL